MSLKSFAEDKHTQADVQAFVMAVLDEEALARVYAGKDTEHIKEAKKILEKSFRRLATLYAPPRKRRVTERGV